MLDLSDRQDAKPVVRPSAQSSASAAEQHSELPVPGELYRHYKGNLYVVHGSGTLEAGAHPAVIYHALDPEQRARHWIRPVREFTSTVKLGGGQVPRFSLVTRPDERALRAATDRVGIPAATVDQVRAQHREPHRFYHDWNHLLFLFRTAEEQGVSLNVEQVVALLYHDIVYVPGAAPGTNEQLSAMMLRAQRRHVGVAFDVEVAAHIILDTAEHLPTCEHSPLVLDLDLSPLAAPVIEYCAFNELVWLENRHLLQSASDARRDFDTRRLRFLLALAERGPLFTQLVKLEDPARDNLEGLRKAWVAKYGNKPGL